MPKRNAPNDIQSLNDLNNLNNIVHDKRNHKRKDAKKHRRDRHYNKLLLSPLRTWVSGGYAEIHLPSALTLFSPALCGYFYRGEHELAEVSLSCFSSALHLATLLIVQTQNRQMCVEQKICWVASIKYFLKYGMFFRNHYYPVQPFFFCKAVKTLGNVFRFYAFIFWMNIFE